MKPMQNQEDPIIYSFDQEVSLSIPHPMKDKIMKLLNLSWIGRENCNKFVNGRYINDVNDPEVDKQLTEAHFNMHRGERVKLTVHVHKSGRKSFGV